MKIQRNINGKNIEIKLTDDEIAAAYKEYMITWMEQTSKHLNPSLSGEEAANAARKAFNIYQNEENGYTPFECIQKAVFDE